MSRVLINGATGNIGSSIIRFSMESDTANEIIAAVWDIIKAKSLFSHYKKLNYVYFNFENPD